MTALIIGFMIDLIVGDPIWLYHPVRLIGHLITITEKRIRSLFPDTDKGAYIGGILFFFIVLSIGTAFPILLLYIAGRIHIYAKFILEIIMCYQLLATKSLKTESMKVYTALKNNDLKGARYAVSMIVGRDTKNLDEKGITKAAVETIAENTSDGIIAPMIFMAIGGAPLGFFYKTINTMDSMVGYKNDKYLYFGRFAALMDDIVNYIPARISGILMIIASYLTGLDGRNAWRIFKRDRFHHASPNSAHTEAVAAGALNVALAGDAYYFGKLYKKQTIGDDIRPIEFEDIKKTNRLLFVTAILTLLIATTVKYTVLLVLA